MKADVLDNDLIKKIQKIEEKYLINNKCKDFKENIFFKQVKEIDDESNNFGKNKNNNKTSKRLKIYSDSESDDDNKNKEENRK